MRAGIDHDALIYRSQEEFLATTVPFLKEGIAIGEGAVVATNEANTAALRQALGGDAEQVMFAPASEVYRSPQSAIAAYDQAMEVFLVDQGRPAARAIGEVAYGPSDAWLRYEPLAHAVFETTPLHVICPYDARMLPARLIDHAVRTHEHLHDGVGRHRNASFEQHGAVLASLPPFSVATPDRSVLELVVDIDGLSGARRTVAELMEKSLPRERARDAVIAVAELLANALMHGDGAACVQVWTSAEQVVVRVSNRGPRIADPLAGFRRPRPSHEGGMGLWLAGQFADEFGVTHDAKGPTVHLMFQR